MMKGEFSLVFPSPNGILFPPIVHRGECLVTAQESSGEVPAAPCSKNYSDAGHMEENNDSCLSPTSPLPPGRAAQGKRGLQFLSWGRVSAWLPQVRGCCQRGPVCLSPSRTLGCAAGLGKADGALGGHQRSRDPTHRFPEPIRKPARQQLGRPQPGLAGLREGKQS